MSWRERRSDSRKRRGGAANRLEENSGRRALAGQSQYLLLKANAATLPVADGVAGLVFVTPPYFGAGRVPRRECNTVDLDAYSGFLGRVLDEAARIARPGAYILFHTDRLPMRRAGNIPRVRFEVFRRSKSTGCAMREAGRWEVAMHLARVDGVKWLGLPVHAYEMLLRKYSRPGEIMVHVFSGTGNSALAAFALGRIPVLVDLHHHRVVRRRLERRLQIGGA